MKRANVVLVVGVVVAAIGTILALTAFALSRRSPGLSCSECVFDLHERSATVTVRNPTDAFIYLHTPCCRWANQERTRPVDFSSETGGYQPAYDVKDGFPPHTQHLIQMIFERPNVASTTPKEIIFRYSLESDPNNIRELHCKPRLR